MDHAPFRPTLAVTTSSGCRQAYAYLMALEQAAEAIQTARGLRGDPGLDHALDRLRLYLLDGHQWLMREEAGCAGDAAA